jgi:DNA-binding PadR family transcriptional regulator
MQEVARLTDGAARMGPGTLYGTIKRLLAAGLLEDRAVPDGHADGSERRRYYRLTALGRRVLQAESARMAVLLGAARAKRVLR